MQLGIINSIFLGSAIDPYTDGIRVVKDIGFDTIDVYPADGEMTDAQLKSSIAIANEVGLPIRSVPLILFGLFDPNRAAREFSVDLAKRVVDMTKIMGADNVLLVNGEYFWQLETGFTKEWIWGSVVEGVRKIGEHAEAVGVRLSIELEPFHMSLINSVDTMEAFLDAVDMPGVVMANVDCSHLDLADIPPTEIQRLAGRICHVHFSDSLETHGDLPPGRGKAPLKEYLKQLNIAGYDGSVALELEWPPDPSREGIIAWATEAYNATNEMMQELGIRD